MNQQTISGTEAIKRMRELRGGQKPFFTMHHLTWDNSKKTTHGLRTVEKCKLRPALPGEKFFPNDDLFLPYMDMDLREPRMCNKKLVRFVAFPPRYDLLQVTWF